MSRPRFTESQAAAAVPAFRHACRSAGMPGWAMALLKLLAKWLPTILMIAAQLLPLMAEPAPDRGHPDPVDDPDVMPEVREAVRLSRFLGLPPEDDR